MPRHGTNSSPTDRQKNFAKVLRRLAERGQKKNWLAAQLGVRAKRVGAGYWEDGVGEPSGTEWRRISVLLDLDLNYLLDPSQTDPPPPTITRDEWEILGFVRALNLPKEEALRRLATLPPGPVVATPVKVTRIQRKLNRKGSNKRGTQR